MITIKEVKTKKEINDFINFPLKLYHDNKYYVPMLYNSEKQIFKKTYPYNKVCDTVFYNAYLDGKMVGRIQGIIQKPANLKWQQKRARFTRFDAIDMQEVADSLFEAVKEWAKEKGMDELVGPLGYSDLEREGLLIEGFDYPQTYEEQYNYSYYQKLIEDYGFIKDVDWVEYQLKAPKEKEERLLRVSNMMLDRYHLTLSTAKNKRDLIKNYAEPLFALIDVCYANLYGTMPLNEEIVNGLVSDFKMILRTKDIGFIKDENGRLVGFALLFPSISSVVQKSKGHITIPFLIRFLKAKKHPKVLDLGLIGVLPEYESKGIATVLIGSLIEIMRNNDLDYVETNLMLEKNAHIINMMKHYDATYTKRRRCFKMDIK